MPDQSVPGHDQEGDIARDEYVRQHPELKEEFGMIFDWLDSLAEHEDLVCQEDTADTNGHRVIGDFKIIRQIGSGGMARVFEAEQLSLNRKVALKILSSHLTLSERAILKFKREAEAAGRQRHQGIVSIYSVGEQNGIYFIAEELVEGGKTLEGLVTEMQQAGEPPTGYFREVAGILARVADALQHAHDSGVIHRDLKPSNILLTEDGDPKVTDFGLAKVEDALALSRTGDFVGTPYYMSPEQTGPTSKDVDHRSDVFSLGVTLYEALTLERPFNGNSSHQIIEKILLREPTNLRRVNPRVPRDLAVICMKAMEKDPRRRFQSMRDFADELRRYLAGESIATRPSGWVRRSLNWAVRHKYRFGAAAALVIVLSVVAISSYVVNREHQRQLEITRNLYRPARETLQLWDRYEGACFWVRDAHEDGPFGELLMGLGMCETGELEKARTNLEKCLPKCINHGEDAMEKDARYLLATVLFRLAEEPDLDPEERRALIDAATAELDRIGPVDPVSEESFVWHYEEAHEDIAGAGAYDDASGEEQDGWDKWFLRPIKVNSNHFLAHLSLGVWLFRDLYMGGQQREFEQAIYHFDEVLAVRPANIPALTFKGRVFYFYARFFNLFNYLERALECSIEAAELSGDDVYPLIFATIGQARLLDGDTAGAKEAFESALDAGKEGDRNVQNVYKGLAMVNAREGDFDAAEQWYFKGRDAMRYDVHVNVDLAEFYLFMGRLNEARKYAREATRQSLWVLIESKRDTYLAKAHLITGLINLQKEDYRTAVENFFRVRDTAVHSPRDLSLAAIVMATFPDELYGQKRKDIEDSLEKMAGQISAKASFMITGSPLCLCAEGVVSYLQGHYNTAIRQFKEAIEARSEWSSTAKNYYWTDRARDLFFLAMAHKKLSLSESLDEEAAAVERQAAQDHYEEAEGLYQKFEPPIEDMGIIKRVRAKAWQVLELD